MKTLAQVILFLSAFAAPAFASIVVKSPSDGQTVGSAVSYTANATTSTCSKGVAAMGVYLDDKLLYTVNGPTLDKTLPVDPGKHGTVVEAWDFCGGANFVKMHIEASQKTGVHLISPASNATVSSPANFVASATTSCATGVASMGIYVNHNLVYVANGSTLNTQLNLGDGAQQTVIEEWDKCGGASYTPLNITVQGAGNILSNLQTSRKWNAWGEFAPSYDICASACGGVTWSMSHDITSPSLSGNATQFNIGGNVPYSDVLWSLPVLGQYSSQNLPDTDHKLLPTLHNFTYDAYFYVTDAAVTQVLEFDISMYMNGAGMIWGNQCNNLGGKEWDIWDNINSKWVSTGVACTLVNNAWNHVTIQAQRESDNTLLYQSITLNGATANINKTYAPFSVPAHWWGVTLNYQMDGDHKQSSNTTYLDNFSLIYW